MKNTRNMKSNMGYDPLYDYLYRTTRNVVRIQVDKVFKKSKPIRIRTVVQCFVIIMKNIQIND